MLDIRNYKMFPAFKNKFLACLPKNYKDPSMLEQCWAWQGAKRGNNYGEISWGRHNSYQAHRISYIIFNGIIPEDKIVRHTCDNPICVNPKHLIVGSMFDNSVDMVKRNRQSAQKLNEEAVKVIKWLLKYKPKRGLAIKLAEIYNILPSTISKIKRNQCWTCVKV